MPTPNIVLDGSQPYGSRTLTINGVAYKANNIQIQRPTTDVEDQSTDGTPGRARYTRQRATLTAELQLATSSTAYPIFGNTFSATFDSNIGSETFVLMLTPWEESNSPSEIRVANITAKTVVNSITTV